MLRDILLGYRHLHCCLCSKVSVHCILYQHLLPWDASLCHFILLYSTLNFSSNSFAFLQKNICIISAAVETELLDTDLSSCFYCFLGDLSVSIRDNSIPLVFDIVSLMVFSIYNLLSNCCVLQKKNSQRFCRVYFGCYELVIIKFDLCSGSEWIGCKTEFGQAEQIIASLCHSSLGNIRRNCVKLDLNCWFLKTTVVYVLIEWTCACLTL